MDIDNDLESIQKSKQREIQEYMKDSLGIEFFVNELDPADLEKQGYRKMSLEEICYVEPWFKIASQLIADKLNEGLNNQAFKAATENTYKCLLDPSMHLATIKGSSDVFLGSGLDNITNKVKGQARWLENDAVLSISNAPNVALNAFNALSFVTGQYFMAQVNAKLSDIKNGIDDIKQYIDAVKQSEVEAARQELYEIIGHVQFILKDPERTRGTIIQIEGVRKVARQNIRLYSNQIERVIKRDTKTDSEKEMTKNIVHLGQYMNQYIYAVNVCSLAQILKIYLNEITDLEELSMFRNDISKTVNSYKEQYNEIVVWGKRYLEETKFLNEMNGPQKALSVGIGLTAGALFSIFITDKGNASFITYKGTASLVNNHFEDIRKKKKEAYIASNDEIQTQMNNDMEFINSLIAAMDEYIELAGRKAEIVSGEGEYFIKYISDK